MALNAVGDIEYRQAPVAGGIRFQTDPPVCTCCAREITRKNFGWAYLEGRGNPLEQFEIIECTACTLIREGGELLATFVARHKL